MEPFPRAQHCWSLSGTRLMDGGSGAPREAHAEDCLSAKSATVADVREFHRRAEGGLSVGERRRHRQAEETVPSCERSELSHIRTLFCRAAFFLLAVFLDTLAHLLYNRY